MNNQKALKSLPLKKYALAGILIFLNHFCFAQPGISSFSPTSGIVGTTVTISGSNFSTTPANDIVYFGAVRANVSNASANSLTVTVPDGATYQPITVTVNGLTAFSPKAFIVSLPVVSNISTNSFAQSIDSTTDLHPNGVVMADIDGDGKPDLATANNYSTTGSPASVSILRNTSSGNNISFAPHQEIFTGVQTFAIAAGDLDGDGKIDMISSSIVDKTISVFRNTSTTGSISFAAKTDYAVGQNPYGIAIGDLDGDGKPDLAVTNYVSNTISIFRNTSSIGNISFAAKMNIPTGVDLGPWGIAIQDLDGDGKADLAVTNNLSSTISVFKNTSTGASISFAASIHFYAGNAPQGIRIGDIDGDGRPDLAWAIDGDNTAFQVERNLSTPGTLSFIASTPFNRNITYAYDVALSDLNGDGKPDLVLSSYGKISVFQNASTVGNVSFGFGGHIDFPGNSPYALAIGDVNGDSYPDLVATNFTSTSLSIFKNQILLPSVTSFTPAIASKGDTVTITGNNFSGATAVYFGGIWASSFSVVNNTTITAVVDTGTGGDIKVTNAYGSGSLAGFSFTGPPAIKSFTPASADSGVVVTLTGINFIQVTGVSFGDVPALSYNVISPTVIQAVVGNGTSGNVSVTNAYGTGFISGFVVAQPVISSFSPTSAGRRDTVTITGTNFSGVTGVSFGGMDADTFSIISPTQINAVVRGGNSGAVSVRTVRPVSIPGFTFVMPAAPMISSVSPDSGRVGSTVTITGDHFSSSVNGNVVYFGATRAKIISASSTILNVIVPEGATYQTITVVNTETWLSGTSNNFFNTTQALKGIIDSTLFAPPLTFTNPNNYDPPQMTLCDFNNDGKVDIVGMSATTFITVRKNTSTKKQISFDDGFILPIIGASGGLDLTSEIRIADMDGDGKKDIVTMKYISNDTGYVSIFRNISTPDSIKFAPQVDFKVPVNIENILVFDIDGDGRMDIVAHGQALGQSLVSTVILQNTSSGAGDMSFELSSYTLPAGVTIAVCEDFDGDGKKDIITGGGLNVYCIQNTSTPGNISFAPAFPIYYASVMDHGVWTISAGDIDGDGKNDLFIVNSGNSSGAYAILRNISSGSNISFANVEINTGGFPNFGALGDIDGDGKPDLVMGELYYNGISIYKNTSSAGNISFAPGQIYNIQDDHRILAIADFDGDNKPDIVLSTGQSDGGLKVLRNKANELEIRFAGINRLCEGDTMTLHSTISSGNQWYRNGQVIPGADADSLLITAGGVYTDTANYHGNLITSDSSVSIAVSQKPLKPTISLDQNNTLVSSSQNNNQWFYAGDSITAATANIFMPLANYGNYLVRVTVDGCSSFSGPYDFEPAAKPDSVVAYPNPVTDWLHVDVNVPDVKSATLDLYTSSGNRILEIQHVQGSTVLYMSTYPPGVYILHIINEADNKVVKVMHILKL